MAYGMNNLTNTTRVSTEHGLGTVFDWDLQTAEVYVTMDTKGMGELCFPFHEVTVFAAAEYKREENKMLHKGNRVLTPRGMGTIRWANDEEVDVLLDDNGRTLGFKTSEVTHLDYQAEHDLDQDSFEVWAALNFIHQLGQRGDAAGDQMHELLKPLANAYNRLKAGKA